MTLDTLTIRRVSLDAIHLDPANARQHGERNMEAITASFQTFGQAEPLIVQRSTGRVISGNGRLVAMRALGWTECDVVEVDLDNTQATALGIAFNRSASLGEWDLDTLSKLLASLEEAGALDGVGFNEKEMQQVLDDLIASQPIDVNQDDIPQAPETATSRFGDIWIIGRHRLMNGDSGDWEDVQRLLAGATMQMANCDLPYNVKVEPRSNNAIAAGLSSFTTTHHQGLDLARHPTKAKRTTEKLRPKDRPLQNDFISDEEFDRLLRAWFTNMARALDAGRALYAWGGYANLANYPAALAECGFYFSQAIVWDKEHPVLTRKDFMGAFELAFYCWKEGAAHQFFGPNNATDLWSVKKLNHTAMVHLTEKPVELAARAIQYSSRPGENVLDLFGGSGSSAAAAHQCDRNAYLMEIDEPYCDVIVMRMQTLTGEPARLESTGQTFEEVKVARDKED
jgi:DNA modification methylase